MSFNRLAPEDFVVSSDSITGPLWTGGSPTTTDITERMRITSAGNVGIGITSPAERLEVSGSLKIGNLKIQNGSSLLWVFPNGQVLIGIWHFTIIFNTEYIFWVNIRFPIPYDLNWVFMLKHIKKFITFTNK